jgi:hypothetical protein
MKITNSDEKKATLRWLFLLAAAYCFAGSEAAGAAAGASVAAGAAGAAAGASVAAGAAAGAGISSFLPQAARAAAAIRAAKTRDLFIFDTRVS